MDIALTPVTSSQIYAWGYDPHSETLAVQFRDKRAEAAQETGKPVAGAVYYYWDFKPLAWEAFQRAPSRYSYFHANIKGKYRFSKATQ